MASPTPTIQRPLGDRLILIAVIVLAIAWMVPMLWVVALSFKDSTQITIDPSSVFRMPYTLQNYADLMVTSNLFVWLGNTLIVSISQTVLVLVISCLAGYGFARIEFPGRGWVFVLVLLGLAIPQHAIIVPLHKFFNDLQLHNSYIALILPDVATPFGVFLMTQYFKAIPRELDEAALLDNASRFKTFWRVLLPLTVPAQATLGIFTFLSAWNDYLWPLISATKPEMYTLTVGLAATQTNIDQSEGLSYLMAQSVFAGLPMLLLFIFFQKYVVQAVAGAAIK